MLVGIIGTGLIGSSVGYAARAAGHRTLGFDADSHTAKRAADVGAVDAVAPSAEAVISVAEVVVVATPLAPALALLSAFPAAPRASLVIDVCSVKVPVVAAARRVPAFVASHPLAGSERTGPDAAAEALLRGRVWAYVPPARLELEERARHFFAELGGRPLAVGAAEHDAVVAFTSHLPQAIATVLGSVLADRMQEPLVLELCGGGMRSMTRLAASAWSVWGGTLEANAGSVAEEVRAFAGILGSVAEALERRDERTLADRFARAANGAAALRANEGVAPFVIPGTPNDTPSRGTA